MKRSVNPIDKLLEVGNAEDERIKSLLETRLGGLAELRDALVERVSSLKVSKSVRLVRENRLNDELAQVRGAPAPRRRC